MEIWRDIPGLEGFYQASDHGRIRSLSRISKSRWGTPKRVVGRVLRAANLGRYMAIGISIDGRTRTGMVQRLVCAAFHGAPSPGMHAAHIDGNAYNNVPSNLRWATPKENCADRSRHGTQVHGTRINTNKLCEDEVRAIRARSRAGECTKALAVEFGVHRSNVQQIMRGVTWKRLEG